MKPATWLLLFAITGCSAMSETGPSLDTIIVYTTRIELLAAFYREGFDLPEPERAPRHCGWRVGSVYFGLDEVDEPPATPGAVRMWFRVDDLDATFAKLQELGAQPHTQPRDMPWGDRLASVLDPDGNVVGLSQRR